jgi:hypothetical protein
MSEDEGLRVTFVSLHYPDLRLPGGFVPDPERYRFREVTVTVQGRKRDLFLLLRCEDRWLVPPEDRWSDEVAEWDFGPEVMGALLARRVVTADQALYVKGLAEPPACPSRPCAV